MKVVFRVNSHACLPRKHVVPPPAWPHTRTPCLATTNLVTATCGLHLNQCEHMKAQCEGCLIFTLNHHFLPNTPYLHLKLYLLASFTLIITLNKLSQPYPPYIHCKIFSSLHRPIFALDHLILPQLPLLPTQAMFPYHTHDIFTQNHLSLPYLIYFHPRPLFSTSDTSSTILTYFYVAQPHPSPLFHTLTSPHPIHSLWSDVEQVG